MRKRRVLGGIAIAVLAVLGLLVAVDGDPGGIASGRAQAQSERYAALSPAELERAGPGVAYFAFGDFSALGTDTLRTSAAPWVVTSALLALRETGGDAERVSSADVEHALRRVGFLYPESIGNWPLPALPSALPGQPLGQNIGHARRLLPPIDVTVSNLGCAACHAGVMYDANGRPDPKRAWLGTPNTSLYLGEWTRTLYRAMVDYGGDDARLWRAIDRLYPQLSTRERLVLRTIVLPELRRRTAELRAANASDLLPFTSGIPGATNGYDALRRRFDLIPADERDHVSLLNSIPDLGGRVMRARLLNTGAYRVPGKPAMRAITRDDVDAAHLHDLSGIVAYFTVPSMGVEADTAALHIGDVEHVLDWLRDYRSQPFPGAVDRARAAEGRALYASACASCHGTYDASLERPRLVSFPNWEGDIGTDPMRAKQFQADVVEAVNTSNYARHLDVHASDRYTAPPLAGIWASAPYFHNGSVPTLWQVLVPEQRATRFVVGGHALDFGDVGIALACDAQRRCAYPAGYRPFSETAVVDTTQPGFGNGGHVREFEALDDAQKRALLEYLKLL